MKKLILIAVIIALNLTFACQKNILVIDGEVVEGYDDTNFVASDWTTDTHGSEAAPNFAEVFDDTQVKRIDIVITPERWQMMLDDMTNLYGEFGAGSGVPDGPPMGGKSVDFLEQADPIFIPAEIFYNGREWYRVGIRFKGNSSLRSTWQEGNMKLSFKVNFDKFEDIYPQIKNQRFFGFSEVSLKNNYEDKSFMREKVAADIFKKAGLVVSHTAFYAVYVDYGEGPIYFGLYTMVEEVDDTVIKEQYSNSSGNLYKPENTGASFAYGTFNQTDFVKKTNETNSDWSDIKNLFSVLHSTNRTSETEQWRNNLDAIFNTDAYLKYLAVNTIIQNWDTYGIMPHNYFLYNNPDDNKLEWIPWDNNEALQEGKMGGALKLDFSNLETNQWPLIEYLYNDTVYKAKYDQYLEDIITTAFEPNYVKGLYAKYSPIIEDYATSENEGYTFLNSSSDFYAAIDELNTHADNRAIAVEEYLSKEKK